MKRLTQRGIWLIGVMLWAMGYHATAAQKPYTPYYKYAYYIDEPATELLLIDPQNPMRPPEVKSLPPGTHLPDEVSSSVLSPNGEWLILYMTDAVFHEKVILLWNTLLGTLREIQRYPAEVEDIYYVAWSANSEYFAFAIVPHDSPTITRDIVYAYSVITDTLTITYESMTGHDPVYILSWSPDSQRLVIGLRDCHLGCGTTGFEMYSLPDGELRTSIRLDKTTDLAIGETCHLRWSPDGRYIAFTATCGMIPSNYDVYLWDLQQNQVRQLTYLSEQDFVGHTLVYANFYNYFWLDPERLFMSYLQAQGELVFDPERFETKTLLYNAATQTSTIIEEAYLEELVQHPTNTSFAYVESHFSLDAENALQQQHVGVHLARVDGQTRVDEFSGDLGCELAWSPDGLYLAYTLPLNPGNANLRCDFDIIGYAFVDTINFTQRELKFAEPTYSAQALGWLSAGLG